MAKQEPIGIYSAERLQRFLDRTYRDAQEMAKRCGVSRATVYNWLSGKTEPNATMLIRIWGAGCNPLFLLSLSNVMLSDSIPGLEWRDKLGENQGVSMETSIRIPTAARDRIAKKLDKRLADLEKEIASTRLILDAFVKGRE